MRKSVKLALAFTALAGAVGATAYAQERGTGDQRGAYMMRLQKALDGADGGITFDQFSDIMGGDLKKIVADNGGKVTVEQLADALEKERFERMARRIIERFDTTGTGTLTTDDIVGREKKVFAMLDRNNDGKIERDELPKRGFGMHRKFDRGDSSVQ